MADKKTVFVGVPMAGKEDAMIERAIQIAKRDYLHVRKADIRDVKFVDNYHDIQELNDQDRWWIEKACKHPNAAYLSNALELIADCDEAIFGRGWEDARGCLIESNVCEYYGIPSIRIMTGEKWIDGPSGTKWRADRKIEVVWAEDIDKELK